MLTILSWCAAAENSWEEFDDLPIMVPLKRPEDAVEPKAPSNKRSQDLLGKTPKLLPLPKK